MDVPMADDMAEFLGLPERESGSCGKVINDWPCGAPATRHVVWSKNSGTTMCQEHADACEEASECLDVHDYDPSTCSHPEAEFNGDVNRCVLP